VRYTSGFDGFFCLQNVLLTLSTALEIRGCCFINLVFHQKFATPPDEISIHRTLQVISEESDTDPFGSSRSSRTHNRHLGDFMDSHSKSSG